MLGVLVNTLTVLVGGTIGLLCRRGIPKRLTDAVMIGLGLCTLYIGIDGALEGENTLVLIASMVLGAIAGTLLDIDGAINRLGMWVESRFKKGERNTVAQGFVTASLLFCVGSMTVVGSLEAGISGDNSMLFTKAALDFCSSAMLAASLGIGVLCSAAFVLIFQGALVLLAGFLAPLLVNPSLLAEMTCAGSLLIAGIGLNLIGVTKLKVANYLPAILFAPILAAIVGIWMP